MLILTEMKRTRGQFENWGRSCINKFDHMVSKTGVEKIYRKSNLSQIVTKMLNKELFHIILTCALSIFCEEYFKIMKL